MNTHAIADASMRPLISVITVCYNAADTILPTLQSVREQTCGDIEHLIIDGASADDTLLLCRREGRAGLRIMSEPDNGLYDAMNKGLEMARGEYVVFLNAGDSFASPATLSHYAAAAEAGSPDIIYGDTVLVDSCGNVLGPRHLQAPKLLTKESFSHGMLVCHQAFMVRRDMAPLYDLRYRFSADYDWTVRCIEATEPGKCVNLNEVTVHYLRDGLTGANHKASLRERFVIMRRHYGLATAIARHLSFIPRAAIRRLRK